MGRDRFSLVVLCRKLLLPAFLSTPSRWRAPALLEFPGHEPHVRIDMVEELLVPGAKIIEALLAVGCADKSVLGTFAVAGKSHFAFTAISRQSVKLVLAELALLGGIHKLADRFSMMLPSLFSGYTKWSQE